MNPIKFTLEKSVTLHQAKRILERALYRYNAAAYEVVIENWEKSPEAVIETLEIELINYGFRSETPDRRGSDRVKGDLLKRMNQAATAAYAFKNQIAKNQSVTGE